jgi:hypothetical protein
MQPSDFRPAHNSGMKGDPRGMNRRFAVNAGRASAEALALFYSVD